MRRSEVFGLRWTQVDFAAMTLRLEETKTGEPLELPLTRQLAAILERRFAERERFPEHRRVWVFPSETSRSGRINSSMQHLNARIGEAGGAKFWFHALRNCFITVADRELMLPNNLTKRLVNHARPQDVTEGYAADWTTEQLRERAQRIADRIDQRVSLSAGAGVRSICRCQHRPERTPRASSGRSPPSKPSTPSNPPKSPTSHGTTGSPASGSTSAT